MQIIAFLLLVLVVMLLLSAKKESVEPRVKYAIAIAIVLLTVMSLIYETQFSKKQDTNREKVNYFEQGGVLTCGDRKVDKIHFGFEPGTQAFIAKKEFEALRGVIISLSDCEVNQQ